LNRFMVGGASFARAAESGSKASITTAATTGKRDMGESVFDSFVLVLRNSHATILRKQRVDLGTVQKELGHSSSEITARVYDQSGLEDDRPAIERALTFAPPAPPPEPSPPPRRGEPVVRLAAPGKSEGPAASRIRRDNGAFRWSGRLDLNQRPLAPQPGPEAAQPSSTLPNAAESFQSAPCPAVQGSQRFATIHRGFATNLLPPIDQLLTVRQVAQFLGVCTATVYKWAAANVLPHVRIVNVIRIRPEDLTRFVAERSP
jgi:excisionase family DNA binding protein